MQPITFGAIQYICLNMRERDRAEIYGMRSHDNPIWLSHEVLAYAAKGWARIAYDGTRPVSIAGATPMWSGVWTIWAFGTDDWPKGVVDLVRWTRNELKPWLLHHGAHRVQCESRFDHTEAHTLLERFGARRECTLSGYGRDGADYYLYAWRKADVL